MGYSWGDYLRQEGWAAAGLQPDGKLRLGEDLRVETLLALAPAADRRAAPLLRVAAVAAAKVAAVKGGPGAAASAAARAVEQGVFELLGFSQHAAAAHFANAMHTCEVCLGFYPIVASQCSSTTSYQISPSVSVFLE